MRTRNKSMRNDGRVDQSLLRGCGWKNSRFGKPGSTGQVLVRLYNLETKADCNSPLLLLVPDVPDLTHEIIAELFQSWDLKEGGYLPMLQYIKISSTNLENSSFRDPAST